MGYFLFLAIGVIFLSYFCCCGDCVGRERLGMGSSQSHPIFSALDELLRAKGTKQYFLGHIQTSVSPWNTQNFVIRKKSGKWRLLQDLQAINAQMQVMGSIQRGLSVLSTLPEKWPLIVIDIKDFFFSIPLDLKDSVRFAFTLPSCDHEELDQRFEWVVLPQGRANSPIMCQLYLGKALEPIRKEYPKLRCVHDILLAAKDENYLQEAYGKMVESLRQWGLHIAPEKVQQEKIVSCLGARIAPTAVWPQKIQSLHTLFQILEGDSELSSERELTPEARKALTLVEEELIKAQLQRCREGLPIILIILPTEMQPTGLLWQEGPLLWIHSKISAGRTSLPYNSGFFSLVGNSALFTIFWYKTQLYCNPL